MIEGWLGVGLAILAGYLLGSIPTGYIVGRMRGVDIRTQGSGNPGATNVVRVLGWPAGITVFLADMGKGLVAAWVLVKFTAFPASEVLRVACGLAAVLGHTFTIFLGFKGGKGVATSCGVFLALAPLSTLAVFSLFVIVVAATRYVSLGSIIAAAFLPLMVWAVGETGQSNWVLILAVGLAATVIVKHRSNIRRLLAGTENRLGASRDTDGNGGRA